MARHKRKRGAADKAGTRNQDQASGPAGAAPFNRPLGQLKQVLSAGQAARPAGNAKTSKETPPAQAPRSKTSHKRSASQTTGHESSKKSQDAPSTTTDRDAQFFLNAMTGVRKLGDPDNPRRPAPKAQRPQAGLGQAQEDQLVVAELEALVRGEVEFNVGSDSDTFHFGTAPGVNQRLLGDLRDGVYATQGHLDLHGKTQDEAHTAVREFILTSRRRGERCVLIITGRGRRSPGGYGVLQEVLPRWLSRAPVRAHVLAFCTAQPVDGGPGAYYVLLRRAGSTAGSPTATGTAAPKKSDR